MGGGDLSSKKPVEWRIICGLVIINLVRWMPITADAPEGRSPGLTP